MATGSPPSQIEIIEKLDENGEIIESTLNGEVVTPRDFDTALCEEKVKDLQKFEGKFNSDTKYMLELELIASEVATDGELSDENTIDSLDYIEGVEEDEQEDDDEESDWEVGGYLLPNLPGIQERFQADLIASRDIVSERQAKNNGDKSVRFANEITINEIPLSHEPEYEHEHKHEKRMQKSPSRFKRNAAAAKINNTKLFKPEIETEGSQLEEKLSSMESEKGTVGSFDFSAEGPGHLQTLTNDDLARSFARGNFDFDGDEALSQSLPRRFGESTGGKNDTSIMASSIVESNFDDDEDEYGFPDSQMGTDILQDPHHLEEIGQAYLELRQKMLKQHLSD